LCHYWDKKLAIGSIADPRCLSPIPDPNFSIPDPGSKRFRIPDPDQHRRIQVFLAEKFVSDLWETGSGMFIPDPDLDFFTYPGSRGQKGTGSRIRIRNTGQRGIFHQNGNQRRLQGGTLLQGWEECFGSGPMWVVQGSHKVHKKMTMDKVPTTLWRSKTKKPDSNPQSEKAFIISEYVILIRVYGLFR
jgi:hypothetical protein